MFLVYFILREFVIVAAGGGDGSRRQERVRGNVSLRVFR